jgi:leucyl aminopeptidase
VKTQRLEPRLTVLDALTGFDAVCALITEDERPLRGAPGLVDWRLCGELSRLLKSGFVTGAPDERLLVPAQERLPVPLVFTYGLGRAGQVSALALEHALAAAAQMLARAKVEAVAVALPALPQVDEAALTQVFERAFGQHFPGRVALFGS